MWVPLATQLMSDHTVIVPDLRDMGLSAVATDGPISPSRAINLRWYITGQGPTDTEYVTK
jgi:hypothetical protein